MPVDHLILRNSLGHCYFKEKSEQKSEMGVVPSRKALQTELRSFYIQSPEPSLWEEWCISLFKMSSLTLSIARELPGYSLQNLWSIWFETFHTNMPRWIIFTTLKQEYSCYKLFSLMKLTFPPVMINSLAPETMMKKLALYSAGKQLFQWRMQGKKLGPSLCSEVTSNWEPLCLVGKPKAEMAL